MAIKFIDAYGGRGKKQTDDPTPFGSTGMTSPNYGTGSAGYKSSYGGNAYNQASPYWQDGGGYTGNSNTYTPPPGMTSPYWKDGGVYTGNSNTYTPPTNYVPSRTALARGSSDYNVPSTSGAIGGGSGGYGYGGGFYYPELNLGVFDDISNQVRGSFDKSRGTLENSYKTYMDDIEKQRGRAQEQFGQGRGTIQENAYNSTRDNMAKLAARGLAGSGLQQLADVQTKMETGNQMSQLAGQYYDYQDELQNNSNEAQNNYQTNLVNLENQLANQLSNVGLQKWQAQNAYDMAMYDAYQNYVNNAGSGISGYSGSLSGAGSASLEEMQANLEMVKSVARQYGLPTDDILSMQTLGSDLGVDIPLNAFFYKNAIKEEENNRPHSKAINPSGNSANVVKGFSR